MMKVQFGSIMEYRLWIMMMMQMEPIIMIDDKTSHDDDECSYTEEEDADCTSVMIKVQRWDRSSHPMLTMIDPHL